MSKQQPAPRDRSRVRTVVGGEAVPPRVLMAGGPPLVVGYLPDYESSATFLNTLSTNKYKGLNQIDYFSVLPTAAGLLPGTSVGGVSNTSTQTSGGYTLTGNSQLKSLVTSAHANGVKVDVVVGGGGSNTDTLDAVVRADQATWDRFAASVKQFAATHNIDGMDIDWEPSQLGSGDVAKYGSFLATVRQANPTLDLSAAVNAYRLPVTSGGSSYVLNATALNSLTSVTVMAYDLNAGNVSPIAQAQSALAGWGSYAQSLGVSKQKLVFGVPFYGTSGNSWATTIAAKYSELVSRNGGPIAPSADSVVLSGVTWNYNGPNTIGAKTAYALNNGYGGVAVWEIGQDYLPGNAYDNTYSLLPRINQAVTANTGTVGGTVTTPAGAAVSGAIVYFDLNGNGQRDGGDPSATTAAAGTYAFAGLLPGTYAVRQIAPAGYTQTTPGAGAALSVVAAAGQTTAANFVDAPPLAVTSLTLTNNGPATSDATQALSFTAALTGGAASDGETVLLKDASRNNAVVATATLTGNSATFIVPAGAVLAGTHGLFATYGGNAALAASTSATLVQTVRLVVTNVTVNGHAPALVGQQRSMVDGLVYTFSEPVTAGTGAFTINVHAGQTGTAPTLQWAALDPAADGSSTRWAVTFSGSGVKGGSIADGEYDLNVTASAVTAAATPAVAAQARAAETFHRLFADTDGNRAVNIFDYLSFQTAFGTRAGESGFKPAFDSDDDGSITIFDYLALQTRFGTSLPVVLVKASAQPVLAGSPKKQSVVTPAAPARTPVAAASPVVAASKPKSRIA